MSQQRPQGAHLTLLDLPPPPSNPDTPSDVPGTPTSTTTSLSALSTTAIKDGHRGTIYHRNHLHNPSPNSLEAERADRISRLTGLSNVSTLHTSITGQQRHNAGSQQTTPTSSGFPAIPTGIALTPAYFDAAGQPVAITKTSTVGSASATESVGGQTAPSTEVGDHYTTTDDRDDDMFTEMDSISASGYTGPDVMDEDLDNLASQSVGGYDDRISDDGNASLVGFGEGAGSTLSGPIYQRRPPVSQGGAGGPASVFTSPPERSSSWYSEEAVSLSSPNPHAGGPAMSQSAAREMLEARMLDGVAVDHSAPGDRPASEGRAVTPVNNDGGDDDVFVDTTTCGPVPVRTSPTASEPVASERPLHHTQRPTARRHPRQHHHPSHAPRSQQYPSLSSSTSSSPSSARSMAEHLLRERREEGDSRVVGRSLVGSRAER
ncbi:hypothetical protein VTJ04DRAFT_7037 [Mycothermus thermophilus]|uniref:uncharacterized protein n=1 Tax=Humicola insolens TaxID=85995 RepID=UPI0037424327